MASNHTQIDATFEQGLAIIFRHPRYGYKAQIETHILSTFQRYIYMPTGIITIIIIVIRIFFKTNVNKYVLCIATA